MAIEVRGIGSVVKLGDDEAQFVLGHMQLSALDALCLLVHAQATTCAPALREASPSFPLLIGLCSERRGDCKLASLPFSAFALIPSPSRLLLLGSVPSMVRPRQRPPCRRGSARGQSSRPPAQIPNPYRCQCRCHGFHDATPIQASQFVDSRSPDPSAPSPAFGSAIFTFSSSSDRPRINAHVSVLFLDEAPSDSEELRGKQQQHQNEGSAFVEEVPGRVAEQGPTLPEASTSKARDVNPVPHPVAAEDEESWGCPVVEE